MLCYLFDSRRETVEGFARRLNLNPEYVARLTNNPRTRIDGQTRLDVVKLLGAFHRRYPETKPPSEYEFYQRKLKLVEESDAPMPAKGTQRRIEEDPDPMGAVRVFRSFDSNGVVREERRYLASDVTRQVKRRILLGMELYLDEIDSVATIVSDSGA